VGKRKFWFEILKAGILNADTCPSKIVLHPKSFIFAVRMAGIRLDDFLGKKKDTTQILDLSKCVARTEEDLQKLLAKVPEFKSKPEKV